MNPRQSGMPYGSKCSRDLRSAAFSATSPMLFAFTKSPRISWAFTKFSPKRLRAIIIPTAITPPMTTARQNAKKMIDSAPPSRPKNAASRG